jgi:ankyrin repeat protein
MNNRGLELLNAAEAGNLEKVEELIASGCDIEIADPEGNSPLLLAFGEGHVDVARALLKNGANPRSLNEDDQTLLHIVSYSEKPEAISFALDIIEDVDATDAEGMTPLHHAVEAECMKAVELFAGRGANINAPDNEGWTPLHYAADKGNTKLIERLIELGANAEAVSSKGNTAGDLANFKNSKR